MLHRGSLRENADRALRIGAISWLGSSSCRPVRLKLKKLAGSVLTAQPETPMKTADVEALSAALLDLLPCDLLDEQIAEAIAEARRRLPYDDLVSYLRNRAGFRPGPDIVLLGLPRTGTSWLFWHFFKSAKAAKIPFKEINFLNFKSLFSNRYYGSEMGRRNWRIYRDIFEKQASDWINAGFIDMTAWSIVHLVGRRDWHWYQTIMGGCGGEVGVDYSPLNFHMSSTTARILKFSSPATRYAIFLRHPIEQYQSLISRRGEQTRKTLTGSENAKNNSEESVTSYLFGRRLKKLIGILDHIEVFYFSDLTRDPVAFMEHFCRRLGVTIDANAVTKDTVNAMELMPSVQFTSEAVDLIRADIAQLEGIVRPSELVIWLRDIERMREASMSTGFATLNGFSRQ